MKEPMKMKTTIALLALAITASANADIIPIDLGPTPRRMKRGEELDTHFASPVLTGHMQLDFQFSDLIRIIPTSRCYFALRFDSAVSALDGVIPNASVMRAAFLDQNGEPIGPLEEIFTSGTGGLISLINAAGNLVYAGGFSPNGFSSLDPSIPITNAYGMRFEFDIIGELGVTDDFFRIGAGHNKEHSGLVLGDVPDTGSTWALLAGALAVCLAVNKQTMKGTNE